MRTTRTGSTELQDDGHCCAAADDMTRVTREGGTSHSHGLNPGPDPAHAALGTGVCAATYQQSRIKHSNSLSTRGARGGQVGSRGATGSADE